MSNLSEVKSFQDGFKNISVHTGINRFTLHNNSDNITDYTSFITINQHLEFKVKSQSDPNKQMTTMGESSVP